MQIFTREREKLFETSNYIQSLGLPLIVTSGYVHNLEVNHRDANKGIALKKLAEYLNIDIKETAAFGDGGNDLKMFEASGHSIAMANAIPPVREAAAYHTLSNNEDGVADFIEKYILV